jgi:hypothetical protein
MEGRRLSLDSPIEGVDERVRRLQRYSGMDLIALDPPTIDHG